MKPVSLIVFLCIAFGLGQSQTSSDVLAESIFTALKAESVACEVDTRLDKILKNHEGLHHCVIANQDFEVLGANVEEALRAIDATTESWKLETFNTYNVHDKRFSLPADDGEYTLLFIDFDRNDDIIILQQSID